MLKLKLQYIGHLMLRTDSLQETLTLGEIEGRRRRGTVEDEMVGCHHWLDGHDFKQNLVVGDGQGRLACWGPWGRKELDKIEQLNCLLKKTCTHTQATAFQFLLPRDGNFTHLLHLFFCPFVKKNEFPFQEQPVPLWPLPWHLPPPQEPCSLDHFSP